ncbi:MAG: carbonic anhydrase [bacterium]
MNILLRSIALVSSLLITAITPACVSSTIGITNVPSEAGGATDPRRATPDAALAALKAGNQRFLSGRQRSKYDEIERVAATAAHQYPIACVFACSDSRTPPEAIFDLGIGEVFVCRVAGVASGVNDEASMEYGTAVLGAPLIVVMGHKNCGAMKAAIANKPLPGALPKLVAQIRPAVKRAESQNPNADAATLLAAATRQQVQAEIDLLMKSPVIRKQVSAGKLKVVGAIYSIKDGTVSWL